MNNPYYSNQILVTAKTTKISIPKSNCTINPALISFKMKDLEIDIITNTT